MISRTLLFLLGLTGVLTVSCTNSGDDNPTPSTDLPQVVTQGGDWRVTYYWDKDKEETHKFSGYTFRFRDDGTVLALKGGNQMAVGQWSISTSSNKFIINLGLSEPLDDLSDDWLIVEKTNSRIKLRDDNDEHLEDVYLER